MSIEFLCPNCDRKYRVNDKYSGKTLNCKSCGKPMYIPQFDDIEESQDTSIPETFQTKSQKANFWEMKQADKKFLATAQQLGYLNETKSNWLLNKIKEFRKKNPKLKIETLALRKGFLFERNIDFILEKMNTLGNFSSKYQQKQNNVVDNMKHQYSRQTNNPSQNYEALESNGWGIAAAVLMFIRGGSIILQSISSFFLSHHIGAITTLIYLFLLFLSVREITVGVELIKRKKTAKTAAYIICGIWITIQSIAFLLLIVIIPKGISKPVLLFFFIGLLYNFIIIWLSSKSAMINNE